MLPPKSSILYLSLSTSHAAHSLLVAAFHNHVFCVIALNINLAISKFPLSFCLPLLQAAACAPAPQLPQTQQQHMHALDLLANAAQAAVLRSAHTQRRVKCTAAAAAADALPWAKNIAHHAFTNNSTAAAVGQQPPPAIPQAPPPPPCAHCMSGDRIPPARGCLCK